jgi:MerR family transcriptional regulator, thiopeptide resistance regulator
MGAGHHTVSQVARMAHVTVRTLHHYDEIGLLAPSGRSRNGYRQYSDQDLRRLHRILLFRELGFSLEEIRGALEDPAFDQREALRRQRAVLEEQIRRKEAVIRALDTTLLALEEGHEMDATEMFQGFEDFDHAQYAEEAEERWGETDAWKESTRRTKSYGKAEWAALKAEVDTLEARWAALLAAGADPGSHDAMEVAEAARLHIDRWFYPCSYAMHEGLAEMYEADPRFRDHYEKRAPGLAAFVAASIRANRRRGDGGGRPSV